MQLVVITSPQSTPNEAQLCKRMHELGLRRLHLRKPAWSKSEAVTFLSRLDEGTLRSVVLHDWHELADKFPVQVRSAKAAIQHSLLTSAIHCHKNVRRACIILKRCALVSLYKQDLL